MSNLIGVEQVSEFIKTVLYTGRIKNGSPISVLLIGTPEVGKTSVITNLIEAGKCKTAVVLTDVTGRGLMELCKGHPEVSHFIFNDLVTVMSHRDSVNRYTLSVIQAMSEEGLKAAAYPGRIEEFSAGKRGIIACSTPGMVKDKRGWWHRHGLASRMLPFFYDHSPSLTLRIKDDINRDVSTKADKTTIRLRIPEKPVSVSVPEAMGEKIRKLSDQRAVLLGDPKGYRRLKQYRALAKAHALVRGERGKKASVKQTDIDWLEKMDAYISYNKAKDL